MQGSHSRGSAACRVLGVLAGLLPAALGCQGRGGRPVRITSPGGMRTLIVDINRNSSQAGYNCVRFRVLNSAGAVEYEVQTKASDVMRWSMRWDGDDCVVLDSADIGTYKWCRDSSGAWHAMDQ